MENRPHRRRFQATSTRYLIKTKLKMALLFLKHGILLSAEPVEKGIGKHFNPSIVLSSLFWSSDPTDFSVCLNNLHLES